MIGFDIVISLELSRPQMPLSTIQLIVIANFHRYVQPILVIRRSYGAGLEYHLNCAASTNAELICNRARDRDESEYFRIDCLGSSPHPLYFYRWALSFIPAAANSGFWKSNSVPHASTCQFPPLTNI